MVGAVVTELNTGRAIRRIASILRFEPATEPVWGKAVLVVGLACLVSHVGSRQAVPIVLSNTLTVNILSSSRDKLMRIVPAHVVQRKRQQWIESDTAQAQAGKSSRQQRQVNHEMVDNNSINRSSVSRGNGTTIWLRNSSVNSTHGAPDISRVVLPHNTQSVTALHHSSQLLVGSNHIFSAEAGGNILDGIVGQSKEDITNVYVAYCIEPTPAQKSIPHQIGGPLIGSQVYLTHN